jgi:hypothetical protein
MNTQPREAERVAYPPFRSQEQLNSRISFLSRPILSVPENEPGKIRERLKICAAYVQKCTIICQDTALHVNRQHGA